MPIDGFAVGLIACFVVAVVLYGTTTDYALPATVNNVTTTVTVLAQYEAFSNIHVFAFVGFGILMTFSANIGLTSAARSLVLGSVAALWYILVQGLMSQAIAGIVYPLATVTLSRDTLVRADFAVCSVLIAFGAVIGRVTALQALLLTVIHVIFYTINEQIGVQRMYINDPGGAMTIHLFGALFGVTGAWVLDRQAGRSEIPGEPVTTPVSNVRALLGTMFIYCYWPSFNCYTTQSFFTNCTTNTYLALLSSAFVAVIISRVVNGTVTLVADVQNAVLAGGVVIAATSNTLVNPFGAIAIGAVAAGVASFAINVVIPAMKRSGVRDSRSVLGLHGIPGFLGGIVAILASATAILYRYPGDSRAVVWRGYLFGFSQSRMTAFQLAYLLLTIGLSVAGGIVAGLVMRLAPSLNRFYSDSEEWTL